MAVDQFWAMYPGELTDEDRFSLTRPGLKLYENGYGASDVWHGGEGPSEFTTYQVVRVSADSAESARRRIVEALGREPAELRIDAGKSEPT